MGGDGCRCSTCDAWAGAGAAPAMHERVQVQHLRCMSGCRCSTCDARSRADMAGARGRLLCGRHVPGAHVHPFLACCSHGWLACCSHGWCVWHATARLPLAGGSATSIAAGNQHRKGQRAEHCACRRKPASTTQMACSCGARGVLVWPPWRARMAPLAC
eukprot:326160-Chlamydomonas_euryale.AAC.3